MANTYYTVVKGDTLSGIASKFGTTVDKLVELNKITDRNKIVVGQKLIVSGSADTTTDNGKTVAVKSFGVVTNTTRTMYVTWAWDQADTEEYQVVWKYFMEPNESSKNGEWLIGSNSNVTVKESTYSPPDYAIAVSVKIKPIAKTVEKSDGTATRKWYGQWSNEKDCTYYFSDAAPSKPSTPNVTIEKYKLTAEIDNVSINASTIEFEVVKDDTTVFKTASAEITTNKATFSCNVDAGSTYKVRCRGTRGVLQGEWSDYSSSVAAAVTSPVIKKIDVLTEKQIKVTWLKVNSAKQYNLQYTTDKDKFNSTSGPEYSKPIDAKDLMEENGSVSCYIYEFTLGKEHFIRINAASENSDPSDWSEIRTFVVGKTPVPPTTWSSDTKVSSGEPLKLYWSHNSEDSSNQSSAKLQLTIDGTSSNEFVVSEFPTTYESGIVKTIYKENPDKEEDKIYVCEINTDHESFKDGSKIEWKVCTAGVIAGDYGDYSAERIVNIYAPPTLQVNLLRANGNSFTTLTSFPFYVKCISGNTANQSPISYYVSIIANESYDTIDNLGNEKMVVKDSAIYSQHFDIESSNPSFEFSASNLSLENNIEYTVKCMVVMNSGLSVTSSVNFSVSWSNESYPPLAEIGINSDNVSAYIRPYVSKGDTDVLLSVYRREFDGSFTEIATDIVPSRNEFVLDPHPALDYARYRIVSKSKTTGVIDFNDIPGYPVNEKSVIIQWDEAWQNFDLTEEVSSDELPWSGSMIKIPYNIDISEDRSPDVSHVNYIGRKRPVSYFGTQLGETATWNMEIPKSDKNTIYALRRLSVWMGNVYVREPSGTGYWATIQLSFSQTHCEVTIPVTMNITRVEGGM